MQRLRSAMRLPPFRRSDSKITPDHFAITPSQVDTLAAQVRDPLTHTERCVDELTFLPTGGHRWTRKLQVLIPRTASPSERSWRIVSLGVYRARRYPDFTVSDCAEQRLNLLTRQQHGVARTEALLSSHIWRFRAQLKRIASSPNSQAANAYKELYDALYTIFTTVDAESLAVQKARFRAGITFIHLLRLLGVQPRDRARQSIEAFAADLRQTVRATEYLCWVRAAAGEAVNVIASYTAQDPLHDLAPLKGLPDAFASIWEGAIQEPRVNRRRIQAKWFVEYGLAPIKYRLAVPSDQRSRSYYFTITAPERSDVTYLDWEAGNSIQHDRNETDSAVPSLHLHNHPTPLDTTGSTGHIIRAYLRCAPNEHKKIAIGAFLNALLVFLIAYGRLHGGLSQEWLIVTPTVLLAYLAQQQRHYFAHTTRRQRAVVWGYLMASVLFLSTIAFNNVAPQAGSAGWGWFTFIIAWLFASSSVVVCTWYAPLGYSFQRITERNTRQTAEQNGNEPVWQIYDQVVHRYCDQIIKATLSAIALVTILVAVTWHLPSSIHQKRASKTYTGGVSIGYHQEK